MWPPLIGGPFFWGIFYFFSILTYFNGGWCGRVMGPWGIEKPCEGASVIDQNMRMDTDIFVLDANIFVQDVTNLHYGSRNNCSRS